MTAPQSDSDAIRAWLDEKDALASKATKGPWMAEYPHESFCGHDCTIDGCHGSHPTGTVELWGPPTMETTWFENVNDPPFIADVRTSLPAALAMVRVLMEALQDTASQLLVDVGDTELDYLPGASCAHDTIDDALARVRRIAEGK